MTIPPHISTIYCGSRFHTVRRKTRVVKVGGLPIGGDHPLVVQSMTTTPTLDVDATVRQCIALAEAGCALVRVTAQNVKAASALGEIRKRFNAAGFADVPLVADIHFLPQAAMEAALHVEKVRINPGNYADKKKFAVMEYSEADYQAELQRLYDAFSPIVLRCKELGRAMRIGTNHGSLSDRIMNRYGDTPLGMCESALEFIRIAESHGFHDIILSMKASNPKVMIEAYRLMVAMMDAEDMHYPLHLGVTEAGDGDDARIKSAIGIGSLLLDGLGDTLRVSLTEDPVAEVPVAAALAEKVSALWAKPVQRTAADAIHPYSYSRRAITPIEFANGLRIGPLEPPVVIQPLQATEPGDLEGFATECRDLAKALRDAAIEFALLDVSTTDAAQLRELRAAVATCAKGVIWDLTHVPFDPTTADALLAASRSGDALLVTTTDDALLWRKEWARLANGWLVLATDPATLADLPREQLTHGTYPVVITLADQPASPFHPVGDYRALAETADATGEILPLWIRNRPDSAIEPQKDYFSNWLLEASCLSGNLLCDGIGDFISCEAVASPRQAVTLSYNVLQGARARTVKTEYVACPSCGRTLFDLQQTTQRIRAATGHLKGVTIAVMGCIVNGPGEMADADFGYVGGAPGKVNLYVGKQCVRYHIPAAEAVDQLIELIREHGKWTEPSAG
jgi:(E)-4-hydroxy-3-methylbut-2-enyl-diphosphate synthase